MTSMETYPQLISKIWSIAIRIPNKTAFYIHHGNMGVSENSVPLNPLVNDHYPY